MMVDEIFGPILAVYKYKNIQEVIDFVNSGDKPLAVYYFGDNNSVESKLLCANTESGSFTVNEFIVQVASTGMPFGGVGTAGYGRYQGIGSR